MAKWVNALVLDNGLNHIKNNANSMRLLSTYAAGDSYATVVANSIAAAAMAPGDFTLGNGASNARTLTVASGKTATASAGSGATPNLHVAFIDTVNSQVLWVTDETTDQVITNGNLVNFGTGPVYTSNQPT